MKEQLTHLLEPLLPDVVLSLVTTAIGLLAILVLGVALTVALRVLFRRAEALVAGRVSRRDPRGEYGKRLTTLMGLLRTISVTLVWFVVITWMLGHAGVNVAPLLASAGIVGLALGFGAQNLVRDVITGLFHILENQVRVGDIVTINGVGGVVEQITYRIIVLRDLEQVVHVIPHGRVATLSNMTKDWSAAVLDVGIAYKENTDQAMAVIQQVGAEMQADPAWQGRILEAVEMFGVDQFADSAVVIRFRIKTMPREQWGVAREFRRRLKHEFDRLGIEFPFPHRTLYFGAATPPLSVRMAPDEEELPAAVPPPPAADYPAPPAGEASARDFPEPPEAPVDEGVEKAPDSEGVPEVPLGRRVPGDEP